jgi:hypothetical protein
MRRSVNCAPLAGSSSCTASFSFSPPISGAGFVVNARARRVFDAFDLGRHGYYPLEVRARSEYLPYWWVQFANDATDRIDFGRSEFLAYTGGFATRETSRIVRVASASELLEQQQMGFGAQPYEEMKPKLLVLRRGREPGPDVFRFAFSLQMYVSIRLKEALEGAGITGLHFNPTRRLAWIEAS